MKKEESIDISVRNLVRFILREGNLISTFGGSSENVDAIKIHQKIQNSYEKDYSKEVSLSYTIKNEEIKLKVSGRADGIINKNNEITIDEIKTTTVPFEFLYEDYNLVHWAQAKCYAFIYCSDNKIENINVQLTYYQMDTKEIKQFKKEFNFIELENFFLDIVSRYIKFAIRLKKFKNTRDKSIKKLEFPFANYREGQRKLAVSVYKTIVEERNFFVQAPTGIGKTMATLFPSIKAMGEGYTSKIFYLTAKTITRTAVENAIYNMRKKGLRIKSVTLTAKDKICFNSNEGCDMENCDYAKGHYNRINNAIFDIIDEENFSREVIENYAEKHKVCPFEFSLELSNFADCIICDYNYIFDPKVYLRHFFVDNKSDFIFLIDESHNLVDRARDMFSAELYKREILSLKKIISKSDKKISKVLNKINTYMIKIRNMCNESNGAYISKEEPKDLILQIREFIILAEKWFLTNKDITGNLKQDILDMYFKALYFVRISQGFDNRYIYYGEKNKDDVKIKLFCLDPSYLLSEVMKRGKSSILFSATLMPMSYFIDMLGGDNNIYKLKLKSPFKRENLCVILEKNISTTYKMRELTYNHIVYDIEEVIKAKSGNYMVFFPSYKYMNEVYNRFLVRNYTIKTLCQESYMDENKREEFLNNFSKDNKETLVAFVVMGGIFSEGIDLVGDRLIGSIIVGVGLPKICLERNIIRGYFDTNNNRGFEYAYMYPGMNKVLQATGRVIRDENDRGVVLLIDERFNYKNYFSILPKEWKNMKVIRNKNQIKGILNTFWKS